MKDTYLIALIIVVTSLFTSKTHILVSDDIYFRCERPLVGIATFLILFGCWLLVLGLEKEGY